MGSPTALQVARKELDRQREEHGDEMPTIAQVIPAIRDFYNTEHATDQLSDVQYDSISILLLHIEDLEAQRQRSLDARNESVNKQGELLKRLERLDQLLPEAVRLMGKIDKSCHEPVPQKILDDPILGKGSCPTYRCGVCSECSANALAKIFARFQAPEGGTSYA